VGKPEGKRPLGSCEFCIEPLGSINAGKLSSVVTSGDLLNSAQLHRDRLVS
jgi:hypothetical protein